MDFLTSNILSWEHSLQKKTQRKCIYNSTCYFSPAAIDVRDVFTRRICLSRDQQNSPSWASSVIYEGKLLSS